MWFYLVGEWHFAKWIIRTSTWPYLGGCRSSLWLSVWMKPMASVKATRIRGQEGEGGGREIPFASKNVSFFYSRDILLHTRLTNHHRLGILSQHCWLRFAFRYLWEYGMTNKDLILLFFPQLPMKVPLWNILLLQVCRNCNGQKSFENRKSTSNVENDLSEN